MYFGLHCCVFLSASPHVQQKQAGANGDGAVGDVEGRKIMLAAHALRRNRSPYRCTIRSYRFPNAPPRMKPSAGRISNRCPAGWPGAAAWLRWRPERRAENPISRTSRQGPEAFGEQAEGDARVFGVDDVEKPGNHGDAYRKPRNGVLIAALGEAIEQDHDRDGDQNGNALTMSLA